MDKPMTTDKPQFDWLEQTVDQLTLARVLELLCGICHEKAEHVATNWQDKPLAQAWRRMALVLDKANSKALECGL